MFAGLAREIRGSFLNGGDALGSWTFTDGSGAFTASADLDKLEGGVPSLLRTGAGLFTLTVPKCRRMVVLGAYLVINSATEATRRKVSILTEVPSTGVVTLSTGLASDDTEADPPSGAVLKVLVRIEGLY